MIRSAKDLIRSARIQSGMTQEEMADGICSPQMLSRIECGTANVSPDTFEALMYRAGFPHTRFPFFQNRSDFECYRALKYARLHLDAWQLAPAFQELQTLKTFHWADNRFYYQEWILLYCRLQFYSYCCNHELLYTALLAALKLTRSSFTADNPTNDLLTRNELELLIALAQEALYLGDTETCTRLICHIDNSLDNGVFSSLEKTRLRAEAAIVRVKHLLSLSDCQNAFRLAEKHRHQMVVDMESAPLFELTFLAGLSAFLSGFRKKADSLIKAAYYTAQHTESCYASACLDYLQKETAFPVTEQMLALPRIPLRKYPEEPFDLSLSFLNPAAVPAKAYDYTIGDIIHDFRMEQGVSQQTLCHGLCSKSKLSKIEGRTLQPDIALAEALLQRLGISERIFSFWGNKREVQFYELKFETMHVRSTKQQELIQKNIERMERLAMEKDVLWKQECLVAKAMLTPSPESLPLLDEALRLTLPDFDIHQILNYRLSWQELSILNNMAYLYGTSDKPCNGILYFLQLLEYQKKTPLDIQMRANIFPATAYMYCNSLYKAKLFHEICTLPTSLDRFVMRYNLTADMLFLFYSCQSLGEYHENDACAMQAVFACNAAYINEYNKTASFLKEYLKDDFQLELLY